VSERRFARIAERAIRCRELSAVDWRVYTCIALHADAAGRAYPGMATIAEMTGVRRQDVPRTIRRLERFRMLCCEPGGGPNGANAYTLIFEDDEVSTTLRTVRNGADPQRHGPGVRNGADGGVRNAATKVSAPVRTKHTKEQTNKHIPAGNDQIAEWFETFWRAYPSRKPHENPKKPARLKFEAAVKRGIDPAAIVRGVENFAVYAAAHIRNPVFIKTAEVWLNKECWNEHQQPPEPEPLRAGMI
jgi:Helix-turn-helix domain